MYVGTINMWNTVTYDFILMNIWTTSVQNGKFYDMKKQTSIWYTILIASKKEKLNSALNTSVTII